MYFFPLQPLSCSNQLLMFRRCFLRYLVLFLLSSFSCSSIELLFFSLEKFFFISCLSFISYDVHNSHSFFFSCVCTFYISFTSGRLHHDIRFYTLFKSSLLFPGRINFKLIIFQGVLKCPRPDKEVLAALVKLWEMGHADSFSLSFHMYFLFSFY